MIRGIGFTYIESSKGLSRGSGSFRNGLDHVSRTRWPPTDLQGFDGPSSFLLLSRPPKYQITIRIHVLAGITPTSGWGTRFGGDEMGRSYGIKYNWKS
jgi:hypothetical protein